MAVLVTNEKVKFTPFREGKKTCWPMVWWGILEPFQPSGIQVRIFENPPQMESHAPLRRISIIESILAWCKEWKQSQSTWSTSDREIKEHDEKTLDRKSLPPFLVLVPEPWVLLWRQRCHLECYRSFIGGEGMNANLSWDFLTARNKTHSITQIYIDTHTKEGLCLSQGHIMKWKVRECN